MNLKNQVEEESEEEEIIVEVNTPSRSELMKAKQYQMDENISDVSDGELSSENEEEEKSPMYKSVQQIDPMRLWAEIWPHSHEKTEYEKNHEEPKLMLPKPSFADKRVAIEKKLRLKAELAMPKRTAYKTRKMGKSFKPKKFNKILKKVRKNYRYIRASNIFNLSLIF